MHADLLNHLAAADRAAVRRWADLLGAPWYNVPPLKLLAESLAVLSALPEVQAREPHLSGGDAFRLAAEAVGFEDDPDANTHPGDRLARNLRNWRHRGKIFHALGAAALQIPGMEQVREAHAAAWARLEAEHGRSIDPAELADDPGGALDQRLAELLGEALVEAEAAVIRDVLSDTLTDHAAKLAGDVADRLALDRREVEEIVCELLTAAVLDALRGDV